jgi:hypothetical protein
MDALQAHHERLLTLHERELRLGAERLLGEATWSLATTAVLLWADGTGRSLVTAVGELGRWIEHLGPELDGFVRLRQQGAEVDEAYRRCLAEEGESFLLAWQAMRGKRPLVTHDDLSRFAYRSQEGFARTPRNLLVTVHWGDRVTAFLVSCERHARKRGA